MIEQLFEVRFLHLLSEFSGQTGPVIFPEPSVESDFYIFFTSVRPSEAPAT